MKITRFFAIIALATTFGLSSVDAQSSDQQRARVNQNVVSVMGGSVTGTYSKVIWDMSTLFDDGYDLRVLPILGKGSVKGIEDLLWLRGIDTAIVQSDVLDFMQQLNVYPDLSNLMRYITVLFNEEIHLLARKEFTSIEELEGKRVSFGPPSTGGFMTSSLVFDRLGITVEALSESHQVGLEMLKNGEIDAMMRVAGAPVKLLESVAFDDGIHLLKIPFVEGSYFNTQLDASTYPTLIPHGESRQTIAVASVLAAYNWPSGHPRRAPVEKLFTELGERYTEFRKEPYHPKWHEVDFDRELPGWTRWRNDSPSS